jgi:hypothetical protein
MLCLPKVSKSEFPALKSVMAKDFPQTYEQWVDLLAGRCLDFGSEDVVIVDINTEEFIAHMRGGGHVLSAQTLFDFAAIDPWRDPDNPEAPKLSRP